MNEEYQSDVLVEESPELREGITDSKETGEFIDRYLDINIKAFDPRASDEERSAVATEILDLHRMLEDSTGLLPDFVRDMRAQLKRIETGFVYVKKLEHAARTLERESRGGILVPHAYRNTVELFQEALANGVNESVIDYFKPYINEYLSRVRAREQGS